MTSLGSFRIQPLPAAVLAAALADDAGSSQCESARLVAEGGEPLRCCLRNAHPGEELILFNYEPPMTASPYRELGAVLAHAAGCEGAGEVDSYPADWHGKPQILRAYDERGWIHDASAIHDGSDPEGAIAKIFTQPDVVEVHSRNVVYGCFMFRITRVESQASRRQ
jgi:hypothetical protein